MNNYKPKLTTLLPLQNRHAQLQLSFRNWKVSVAGSQAKPRKRDYSSESSALRPFRTKLVPGSWHRSAKSSFQRSARAQGQSTEGHFCSTFHSLLQQARKVGQVWGAPVRESYKQLENQTKLLPPSLQPSVAISSPPSCYAKAVIVETDLALAIFHLSIFWQVASWQIALHTILTHWLPEEKVGLYTGEPIPPGDLGLFSSRLSMSPWFYHQQAALLLRPWSAWLGRCSYPLDKWTNILVLLLNQLWGSHFLLQLICGW